MGIAASGARVHWALIRGMNLASAEGEWAKFVISVLMSLSLERGDKIQTKDKNCSLVIRHFSSALASFGSSVPCGSAISDWMSTWTPQLSHAVSRRAGG